MAVSSLEAAASADLGQSRPSLASEQVGQGHRLQVEREELVVERPLVTRRALHAAAICGGGAEGV